MTNKIIVITGQTATGKTQLALEYAKKYNGELVNCDSRQIYKKLNIITGKDINENQKSKIKNQKFNEIKVINNFHIGYYSLTSNYSLQPTYSNLLTKLWLYDIVDPKEYFSSYDYVQCTQTVIKDILSRKKTPIIIGGTGLYLKHLLYGFDYAVQPNWPLRLKLGKKTLKQLQDILQKLIIRASKQSFQPPGLKIVSQQSKHTSLLTINNSDFNNPRRLIRRIEILSSPSIPNLPNLPNYPNVKLISLKYKNKTDLINAIQIRVEKRLKQGAIEEVKNLLSFGYTEDDPGLKTIGYQQIIQYLKNKLTKEEATQQWITAEVQYAKRQVTFLNKLPNIQWKYI